MGTFVENTIRIDVCQLYRMGFIHAGQSIFRSHGQSLNITWVSVLSGRAVKPYWVCPKSFTKVGVLYLGGDGFARRQYYKLSYWGQTQSRANRICAAAHKMRQILGCPGGLYLPLIKPKGMRWKTFNKWQEKYNKAAGGYFLASEGRINKLLGKN